jgi:5-oxoprolinase (ATP-hydrolysing)
VGSSQGLCHPTQRSCIRSFKIVKKGEFDLDGVTRILVSEPMQYPGCSGTRCFKDNVSDLKGLHILTIDRCMRIFDRTLSFVAQIAANQRGINLLQGLMDEYGQGCVQAYMRFIQQVRSSYVSIAVEKSISCWIECLFCRPKHVN